MKSWEDKLKEQLDDFSPEPPASVWEGISKNLPSPTPAPVAGLKSSLWFKGGLALLSAAAVLTTAYWLNGRSEPESSMPAPVPVLESPVEVRPNRSMEEKSTSPSTEASDNPTRSESSEGSNQQQQAPVSPVTKAVDPVAPGAAATSTPEINRTLNGAEPISKSEQVVSPAPASETPAGKATKTAAALILNTRGGFAPLKVHAMIAEVSGLADFDFGDGNQALRQNSATHVYQEAGVFTLKMMGADQNLQTATIEVLGLLPTAFSPNGDGVNDDYILEGEAFEEVNLRIFDRNGRIIYQNKAKRISWDGKNLSGSPAESGTYFYDIFAQSVSGGKYSQKGTISLFR